MTHPRINALEAAEDALRKISRMQTMPDHKYNTVTLVAAHAVANEALAQLSAMRKEGGQLGDVCKMCKGEGRWTDAEPGDIWCREFQCRACGGSCGSGLIGKILHYLKFESVGHTEVDAVAIANMLLPGPPAQPEKGN